MKYFVAALLALLMAACSNSEPSALQGQGKVNPERPLPPPIDDLVDPSPKTAAPAAPETPEERRARLERIRDSLPRVDASAPHTLILTMQSWEKVLRPEVMDAVRLGLMVLPIKLQDRLVQTARANGRMPTLSDQELFRQAYSEVHGMRYDEFLFHVQPLITKYEDQLRNPSALTDPPNPSGGAGPVPGFGN